jgi:ornithine cyclodeaminase
MIRIITPDDIKSLLKKIGLKEFFVQLIAQLESDFSRWDEFMKSPRPAFHYPHGVIELMPISDHNYFSFKYVNGHPRNPVTNKLTVVATGQLSEVKSGYPILFSEMTFLTAFRTAATAAIASKYLARKDAKILAIIGTGSQSEFLVLAHYFALGIKTIHYFDIDPHAMQKFAKNLEQFPLELKPYGLIEDALKHADIIITATAGKNRLKIIDNEWVRPGVHICGIGGDCPGKTELDPYILTRAKIVVEYYHQSKAEGEIQNLEAEDVYAELWELIAGVKPGREGENEITLFDSVGFALEDYSILRLVERLAQGQGLGQQVNLLPEIEDPKNLFGEFESLFSGSGD